jgi:cytochrome c553
LAVSESLSKDEIRRIIETELSEQDAEALAGWYAGFARGVASYPPDDLKRVEPPLRSVPGPVAQ